MGMFAFSIFFSNSAGVPFSGEERKVFFPFRRSVTLEPCTVILGEVSFPCAELQKDTYAFSPSIDSDWLQYVNRHLR